MIKSLGSRVVVVLWRMKAMLMNVDTKQFPAKLILHNGETSSLPYEWFSKKFSDDAIFAQRRIG